MVLLPLNSLIYNVQVNTQQGPIDLLPLSLTGTTKPTQWTLLLSLGPSTHTPVATTELGELARLSLEFERRGIRTLASCEGGLGEIQGWIVDVKYATGQQVEFPIVS